MTAHHVWPNKQDIILAPFLLYEYSHTAVCDTQIAAGELGPQQIPWCHAWTEAAARGPRQAHGTPLTHWIPPVTPSTPHRSTQQGHLSAGHFQKKDFDQSDASDDHPGPMDTQ